jgi:microcin C transport system permease protein
MTAYIVRRLLLIVPTLLGIMIVNFAIIQAAPGGPIDVILAEMRGLSTDATQRISGSGGAETQNRNQNAQRDSGRQYRGAQGIDPTLIAELEREFGFDKPPLERFGAMIVKFLTFDFGRSFFKDRPVIDLVLEKMPISISLGLWTTLLVYLISIPLGIRKAVKDGSRFDVWSSGAIIVGYAIPGFLFAILLIVLFAGGRFLDWFPLRGIASENWRELSYPALVLDYLWHMTLPVLAMVIGGFAGLTMLTKNSFMDEIGKQYVVTARAKGLAETRVLYGHVFRNAMLIVIAGFPGAFVSIFFTGSLLIEIIFSLDGLGLLGFEAAVNRDYPLMFATLYFFTLLGLAMKIVSDITYMLVDPRIDFEGRG